MTTPPFIFNIFVNDIVLVLNYSYILLFADYAKFFKLVNSKRNVEHLQKDLNNIYDLCNSNEMNLNINKCKTISFSKKRNLITFNYNLASHNLTLDFQIKDIRIIFDSKLLINIHVLKILKKTLSVFWYN